MNDLLTAPDNRRSKASLDRLEQRSESLNIRDRTLAIALACSYEYVTA